MDIVCLFILFIGPALVRFRLSQNMLNCIDDDYIVYNQLSTVHLRSSKSIMTLGFAADTCSQMVAQCDTLMMMTMMMRRRRLRMMRMRIVKKVLEVENGDDDDTYSQMVALGETLMMMIRIVKIIDIDNGDGDGDNTYSHIIRSPIHVSLAHM